MNPTRIITLLVMAFVVLMFILSFVPELETAIGLTTITNTFVLAMLEMMIWIIPIGALIAIIVAVFALTKGGGRGG